MCIRVRCSCARAEVKLGGVYVCFLFQAEDGIRDLVRSRGLGDGYKRQALDGIDIKIVDDEGRELPRLETGEVIIRGANVMQGYYKDEAATASVIKDGWLHTGDLGRMDEEGYIFLTGRKKRMIITSGFNVYPQEVEDVLRLHPAVADVIVAGKEDLMRGEVVKASVVLRQGHRPEEKEIIRYCKEYLSAYKAPREVEFVTSLGTAGR
mgnify:CR=1 FL=1